MKPGWTKRAANFVPLTPLSPSDARHWSFQTSDGGGLRRASANLCGVPRARHRLASALAGPGVQPGDVVATILPNIPAQAEAHFGVPACGAVLNTINTRLDVDTVAYILDHGEAKVVLVDRNSCQWPRRPSPDGRPCAQGDRSGGRGRPGSRRRAITPTYEALLAAPGDPDLTGSCPRTNGKASRSTTPPAPRGGPRAWSITTAAPT
jgi:fatty-acyl-CoA synthase